MSKIAIIGAGISGLACARVLGVHGNNVTLFDKGRGPGGRLSTRRVTTQSGEVSFDHGAQFFTARDPEFVALVLHLVDQGFVAPWVGRHVQLANDGVHDRQNREPIYVGTPGMNGVVRGLAQHHDVQWGTRIEALTRDQGAWLLSDDTGKDLGHFDQVVLAVPAEQVAPLLGNHALDITHHASSIVSLPCWAGMYTFEKPLEIQFDSARLEGHGVIDFIAANHSKPGRGAIPAYVVHARADWSQAHLESDADTVAQALLEAFLALTSCAQHQMISIAHRWRYAKVEVKNGMGYRFDHGAQIGVCGDWLMGPRVESAWQSGHQLGLMMTGALPRSMSQASKAGA